MFDMLQMMDLRWVNLEVAAYSAAEPNTWVPKRRHVLRLLRYNFRDPGDLLVGLVLFDD